MKSLNSINAKDNTPARCLLVAALLLTLLTIAACGSPPPRVPDAYKKAYDLNRKGETAFINGDDQKAIGFYNDALQTNISMEDFDGMAINLNNLATVYRATGNRAEADGCVDEILNAPAGQYVRDRLAEAAYLKAILRADAGEYNESGLWADKALINCTGPDGQMAGKVCNLKSRLALKQKDYKAAASFGEKAAKLNDGLKDGAEKANSHRLVAAAYAGQGRMNEARKFYEQALALDKELGLGKKVALDLIGIGNVLYSQKDYAGAKNYFKRAVSVCEGGGYAETGKEAAALAEKCGQAIGKGKL